MRQEVSELRSIRSVWSERGVSLWHQVEEQRWIYPSGGEVA